MDSPLTHKSAARARRGTMEPTVPNSAVTARPLAEAVARVVRHEVGDLLQTVYAAVAILLKRLPPDWSTERRVLADMRARAETCKQLLDQVHDYACTLQLTREPIDLAGVVADLVEGVTGQYPGLTIQPELEKAVMVEADVNRLTQVGLILLRHACESAQRNVHVTVRSVADARSVVWSFRDDGPGLAPQQVQEAFLPLSHTRQGRPALSLALAQKIVEAHGGRLTLANLPEGGIEVAASLPAAASRT